MPASRASVDFAICLAISIGYTFLSLEASASPATHGGLAQIGRLFDRTDVIHDEQAYGRPGRSINLSQFGMVLGDEAAPVAALAGLSPPATVSDPAYFLAGAVSVQDSDVVTDAAGLVGGVDIPWGEGARLGVAAGVTATPDGRSGRSLALYGTRWLSPSVMAEWVLGAGFSGSGPATGMAGAGLHWDWQPSADWHLHAEADLRYAWSDDDTEAMGAGLSLDASYRTMIGDTSIAFESRTAIESTSGSGIGDGGVDLTLSQGVRAELMAGLEVSLDHSFAAIAGGEPVQSVLVALKARL